MKLKSVLFLMIIGVRLFTTLVHADQDDSKFRINIVGTWEEDQIDSYGHAIFYSDGRYEGKIFDSFKKEKLLVFAKGTWWIKDGKLYNLIESIVPSEFPFKKEPYIDVIVDISDQSLIFIDEDGVKYNKTKVPDELFDLPLIQ